MAPIRNHRLKRSSSTESLYSIATSITAKRTTSIDCTSRATSCVGCRTRKMKCDRRDPCASCSMRGEPCIWPGKVPPPREDAETRIKKELQETRAELDKMRSLNEILSRKLSHFEGYNSSLRPSVELSDSSSPVSGPITPVLSPFVDMTYGNMSKFSSHSSLEPPPTPPYSDQSSPKSYANSSPEVISIDKEAPQLSIMTGLNTAKQQQISPLMARYPYPTFASQEMSSGSMMGDVMLPMAPYGTATSMTPMTPMGMPMGPAIPFCYPEMMAAAYGYMPMTMGAVPMTSLNASDHYPSQQLPVPVSFGQEGFPSFSLEGNKLSNYN